jgi:hypothetical protein
MAFVSPPTEVKLTENFGIVKIHTLSKCKRRIN